MQTIQEMPPLLQILVGGVVLYVIVKIMTAIFERRRLVEKYGKEIGLRIYNKEIWQGMTTEQLSESWGDPSDIEHAVLKKKTKETWKYTRIGKNRYRQRVFVENGIVVGWKG